MDRLELFERTLSGWRHFSTGCSADTYMALTSFLEMLVRIEKRVRQGDRSVSNEEIAAFEAFAPSDADVGVLAGIGTREVTDASLTNYLAQTEGEAKKLRKKLRAD